MSFLFLTRSGCEEQEAVWIEKDARTKGGLKKKKVRLRMTGVMFVL